MFLDYIKVLGISQNINKLVIGQEVESGEGSTLRFHVVFQLLLNVVENCIEVLKIIKGPIVSPDNFNARWCFLGFHHQHFEIFVYHFEVLCILWHCLSNIWGLENVL